MSARVYLDSAPAHPGPSWTRFVCISDTHSRTFPLPPGDALLHGGDLTSWGYPDQLAVTIEWLKQMPHPVKILIAGNHDFCLDEQWYKKEFNSTREVDAARAILSEQAAQDAGIVYLENESFKFTTTSGREWEVFGSPGSPLHCTNAFQYTSISEAKEVWSHIPQDTEILITHTPPKDTLDLTSNGKHAGCRVLRNRLGELAACRLHVFGHIHEAYGAKMTPEPPWKVSVNAALYRTTGQAIVVDLEN